MVSLMITCCVCVVMLPASVYVHVMVVFPMIGVLVVVAAIIDLPEQFMAVGGVKEVISHCAVSSFSDGTFGMIAVTSITTSCVWVAVLFDASVYVHVIVVLDIIGKLVMLLLTMTVPY